MLTSLADVPLPVSAKSGLAIGSGIALLFACFLAYLVMQVQHHKASTNDWPSLWSPRGLFKFHHLGKGWQPLRISEETEWETEPQAGKRGITPGTTELMPYSVRVPFTGLGNSTTLIVENGSGSDSGDGRQDAMMSTLDRYHPSSHTCLPVGLSKTMCVLGIWSCMLRLFMQRATFMFCSAEVTRVRVVESFERLASDTRQKSTLRFAICSRIRQSIS
jgi:hypothetical protein